MELMKSKFLMEPKMDIRQESAFKDFPKVNVRLIVGLYTMDFANTSNKCVFAGGDGVGLMIAIMPFKE